MKEEQVSYAGLYSVDNNLFMSKSKEYTTELCYSLGIFRIRFIRKEIKLVTNYSEDMENNIRYYLRDGKILRCNWLAGVTNNYSADDGGCDGDGRNFETEKKKVADFEIVDNFNPKKIDKLILPGVGSFSEFAKGIRDDQKNSIIEFSKLNKPILGICLGAQFLFSKSFEHGNFDGLNLILMV